MLTFQLLRRRPGLLEPEILSPSLHSGHPNADPTPDPTPDPNPDSNPDSNPDPTSDCNAGIGPTDLSLAAVSPVKVSYFHRNVCEQHLDCLLKSGG